VTVGVSRGPGRTAIQLSLVAGAASVGGLAIAGVPSGLAAGAVGTLVLAAGVVAGSRRLLDYAAIGLFLAVVFSGVGGARPAPLLVSMVAAVVAWDAGEQAINVGEQLGRDARTRRAEVVHVASTTIVGMGGAALGYGVYRLAGGGRPASALVVLLLGAVLITWALRG